MRKFLLMVAACAIATPAVAQRVTQGASKGSISNSARVEQMAGAMAFSQVGQGERVTLETPRSDQPSASDPMVRRHIHWAKDR